MSFRSNPKNPKYEVFFGDKKYLFRGTILYEILDREDSGKKWRFKDWVGESLEDTPLGTSFKLFCQESKNKRYQANELNEGREEVLCRLLKGESVDAELPKHFTAPLETLHKIPAALQTLYGPLEAIHREGGLGKHRDYQATTATHADIGIELKCSTKKLSAKDTKELTYRPWLIAVQFLQGQLKSALGKRFLGACGDTMVSKWFQERIVPFVAKHSDVLPTECLTMTEAVYMTAMYDMNAKKTPNKSSGYKFIEALRTHTTLAEDIKKEWKQFQNLYLQTSHPDPNDLFEVVKEAMDAKDVWICVTKDNAYVIEGIRVTAVRFKQDKMYRDTRVLQYEMDVHKISSEDTHTIPIELRFHWKNGGQGIQNINFLLE
jgi:hypothetical protein